MPRTVEQFYEMDHEYLMDFVGTQLFEFPMTKAEACVLCDANHGAMLLQGSWEGLWANIIDTPADSLSVKWDTDATALAERIRTSGRGVKFALSVSCAVFWRNCGLPHDEALAIANFNIFN